MSKGRKQGNLYGSSWQWEIFRTRMKFRHRVAKPRSCRPSWKECRKLGSDWCGDVDSLSWPLSLLVGGDWNIFMTFHMLGISLAQLTFIFFGVGQPPTRLDLCSWKRPVGLVAVRCCTVVVGHIASNMASIPEMCLRSPISGGKPSVWNHRLTTRFAWCFGQGKKMEKEGMIPQQACNQRSGTRTLSSRMIVSLTWG